MRRTPDYWLSLTAAFLGALSLASVLCLHFPSVLTSPDLRAVYPMPLVRGLIQAAIVAAFALGLLACVRSGSLRRGGSGMMLAAVAILLGGAEVPVQTPVEKSAYLGLDWFILSLLVTALLFVPLERAWPLRREQGPLREGWRTDGAWFFASHALVQVLSFLILLPAGLATKVVAVPQLHAVVGALPVVVQFALAVVVADLAQYWIHRAFHRVPILWRFHAVHHSVERMDWLAGSRLHLVDVVVTRGLVLLPLAVLGFSPAAIYAYLAFVSVHAVFIHANFAPGSGRLESFLVMPRFHHWHHARDPRAVDRNFAVHLPWLDRCFGTFVLPENEWPAAYGLVGEQAPGTFWGQLMWPLSRRR